MRRRGHHGGPERGRLRVIPERGVRSRGAGQRLDALGLELRGASEGAEGLGLALGLGIGLGWVWGYDYD